MKKVVFSLGTLLSAAIMVAQSSTANLDQSGDLNIANITQEGRFTSTTVQVGTGNNAEVIQELELAQGNDPDFPYIYGPATGTITQTQKGDYNSVFAHQGPGFDSKIDQVQRGNKNFASSSQNTIDHGSYQRSMQLQEGNNNYATSSQWDGNDPFNYVRQKQFGDYNNATASQKGEENIISITQTGSFNTASSSQSGAFITGSITQFGNSNSAHQIQGDFNYAVIRQWGDNNTVLQEQSRSVNDLVALQGSSSFNSSGSFISQIQEGHSNSASAEQNILSEGGENIINQRQLGFDNNAKATQEGIVGVLEGNNAMIQQQIGDGNEISSSQNGAENLSDILQEGNLNTVLNTQTGTGNYTLVKQTNQLNTSTILQNGTNNTAIALQNGMNNTVIINQGGSL
ncbi:hypothetical protein [Aquimarina sp. RZ0]|uniref:hypothetical protein n=1 Tax=Aquimarina sp. RZ0 TaxID=2607730 RepID=UPI0011F13EF4|nr:hypothetical protein [Aquimarina sp. RZ0]KAA1246535.1 hypothetical protein F0000_07175 [Aquimarina sp. RZ0]